MKAFWLASFLEVILDAYPDFAKNAARHESVVNRDRGSGGSQNNQKTSKNKVENITKAKLEKCTIFNRLRIHSR